jgi:hypothetical protein
MNWNPTENCFLITYHPSSIMVHSWALVHFGWLTPGTFGFRERWLHGNKEVEEPGEDKTALSRKVVAGSVVAGSREREREIGIRMSSSSMIATL